MIIQLISKLRKRVQDAPLWWLVRTSLWSIALFILFVVLFKYAENADWEESVWQAWQTFTTVGYGNAPAETSAGRVVTMLISTLGIAFVGALFSAAFDYKQYLKDKKRLGYMKNPHKNGYVVFNFPESSTASNLINELRTVEESIGICFVDSQLEELPQSIARIPDIHFVKGDILQKNTYDMANITEAKAVLVFPLKPGVADSDAATKTVVDLIARFTKGYDTRIIYTLVDAKNNWMFDAPQSTHILADLEVLAMVQECQDEHSAEIVERLLMNTEGANPQTVKPNKVIGWTWGELSLGMVQVSQQHPELACNLFALVSGQQNDTCPSYDTKIEDHHRISVLAYSSLQWDKLEEALEQDKGR